MYTEFDDIYAEIVICTFIYLFNIHVYYWDRRLFSVGKHHLTFDTYEKREKESKLLPQYIYLSNGYFSPVLFHREIKNARAIKRDYELPGAIAALYGSDLSLVERKISDPLMGTG